jgi:hypothetical protein
MPVTLSAAKGLARRTERSFASLRACPERSEGMTARTQLKSSHGKSYLQMSNYFSGVLIFFRYNAIIVRE